MFFELWQFQPRVYLLGVSITIQTIILQPRKDKKLSLSDDHDQIRRGIDPCLLLPNEALAERVLLCPRLVPSLRQPPCSAASSSSSFSIFFLVLADGLVMRWLAKNNDMTDMRVPTNTMPMIWIKVKPATSNIGTYHGRKSTYIFWDNLLAPLKIFLSLFKQYECKIFFTSKK